MKCLKFVAWTLDPKKGFTPFGIRQGLIVSALVGLFLFLGFHASFAHSNKSDTSPLPTLYPAPEFSGLANWINSKEIKSMRELRGKVVLVDFWTYSCFNCVNTFPYVQGWHEKFKDEGLVVLGIHAPEFAFERDSDNVKKAVKKYGLTYPIALDNGFKLWRAYRNRYWPAFYLIDKQGMVRYTHFGEGRYKEMEAAIASLLK
jgi:thiol-disulfide isomerase/thioredoxin